MCTQIHTTLCTTTRHTTPSNVAQSQFSRDEETDFDLENLPASGFIGTGRGIKAGKKVKLNETQTSAAIAAQFVFCRQIFCSTAWTRHSEYLEQPRIAFGTTVGQQGLRTAAISELCLM